MNEYDIIRYLVDNLNIEIDRYSDYYSNINEVTVTLKLGKNIIDQSTCSLIDEK